MTKRMLIDASHGEETRVVVLDGNRLEDFDVETASKKQLKGNIYLAKVVRVEPSLQAAFVEYGGNRHGFLAFAEIHPDYYQIPVADRQRLLDMQEAEARAEEEAEDEAAARDAAAEAAPEIPPELTPELAPQPRQIPILSSPPAETVPDEDAPAAPLIVPQAQRYANGADHAAEHDGLEQDEPAGAADPDAELAPSTAEPAPPAEMSGGGEDVFPDIAPGPADGGAGPIPGVDPEVMPDVAPDTLPAEEAIEHPEGELPPGSPDRGFVDGTDPESGEPVSTLPQDVSVAAEEGPGLFETAPVQAEHATGDVETLASDGMEILPPARVGGSGENDDAKERRQSARHLRSYKIQEVIRRRQILLIQVVKEERGTKGAALTTYISLAGRFSVLMPNSPRGGGISRKITSAADRRRLKEITTELQIPRGMGMIIRTAGAQRPKPEIRRDCEYLLRLWDDIRDTTMRSMAPALIYEEASLIKRSIRDVYSASVDEILVDGEDGWRAARDFMRTLMPAHARKVQLWRDPTGQPLFAKQQVEAQLDAMLSPTVQLRSGGYLVINQTEALVAIDVNSGRSTRERGIEETAVRTNLEAADEVARQLRLRDLAGLIVIDFIDMESRRNNVAVEKRITDALKTDRARIQIGHISSFGLLEMSRQRLRPSLTETSFVACPHCAGTGLVRSTESAVLHVLRGVEEEAGRHRAAEITVHVAAAHAVYLLNHKRARVSEIEQRSGVAICFAGDEGLPTGTLFRIERSGVYTPPETPYEAPAALPPSLADAEDAFEAEEAPEILAEEPPPQAAVPGSDAADSAADEAAVKRRRRRRRGRRDEAGDVTGAGQAALADGESDAASDEDGIAAPNPDTLAEPSESAPPDVMPNGATLNATPDSAPLAAMPKGVDDTTSEQAPAPIAEAPAAGLAEAETEDGEAPKARRRGRRGGRRKPREADEAADVTEEQPALPPVYTGPTPADPFALGGFDVFDVIEQAEQREAMLARSPSPAPINEAPQPSDAAETEAAPPPPAEPLVTPLPEVIPTPSAPHMADAATASEPAPTPTLAAPLTAVPDGPPAEAEPEPVQGPAMQPVLIGASPQTEKKRGWWRR